MKKFFTFALCFILVSTNISFANNNHITNSIKDIEIVNNRTNIMIKKIISDDSFETSELKKDIDFCECMLAEQSNKISTLYSKESDLELRKAYSSILYTITLYELSLNSMLVYVNNTNKINYFIDTCSSYSVGENSLKNIKSRYN